MSVGSLISVRPISNSSRPRCGCRTRRGRPPSCSIAWWMIAVGVAYQEYHGVYGEAVEAALRFLFNAMAPKADETFPFKAAPHVVYG